MTSSSSARLTASDLCLMESPLLICITPESNECERSKPFYIRSVPLTLSLSPNVGERERVRGLNGKRLNAFV